MHNTAIFRLNSSDLYGEKVSKLLYSEDIDPLVV